MPKILLREIFGIIFFAAIVNMRIFVDFCQDVLVNIFGHNFFRGNMRVLSHTHRHADLGGY